MNISPDTLFGQYEGRIHELAEAARKLIRQELPEIKEEVDLPAKMIAYGFGPGYKGMVCTILLSKKGIKLGFYKGGELPDPDQLLTGTGKVHRYVEIQTAADLKKPALKKLLKVAGETCKKRLTP